MSRSDPDYPRLSLPWGERDDAAYEAEPAAPWAGLFWQSLSVKLERTWWATYQAAKRRGLRAKVDRSARAKCGECGKVAKAMGLCERHYGMQAAQDGKPWALRRYRGFDA